MNIKKCSQCGTKENLVQVNLLVPKVTIYQCVDCKRRSEAQTQLRADELQRQLLIKH